MKKRFYFLLIVTIFSTSEKNYAAVGEGISERGVISSASPHTIIPVGKYKYDQSGVGGIALGASLVGFVGVATTSSLFYFTTELLGFIGGELVTKSLEYAFTALLGQEPKNIIVGFIYSGNPNEPITNEDIIYLADYEFGPTIKIGKPIKVFTYPSEFDEQPSYLPPKLGKILYVHDTINIPGLGEYKTVAEASAKMGPQIPLLNENFNFHTVGVVSGYTISNGKLYMILTQFTVPRWIFRNLSNNLLMSFIPVDVSIRSNFPKIGSVVRVGGKSVRLKNIIKQDFGRFYKSECIYALVPSEFEIMKGQPVTNVPVETSIFYLLDTEYGTSIGFNFKENISNAPDFKLTNLSITPDESMVFGNNYTIETSISNNGDLAGSCTIRLYYYDVSFENLIGEIPVVDLIPGWQQEDALIWSFNQFNVVPGKPFYIYAIAEDPSKFEFVQTNNRIYTERVLASDNSFLEFSAYCPVTLKVSTSDGNYIDMYANQIPEAEYRLDDYNNDNRLDHRIYIPINTTGSYSIEVKPDSIADPTDKYTLTARENSQISVLADSVQIKDIPPAPYYYEPTEVNEINRIPSNYSLSQNYPNPFNPSTKISFTLPESSYLSLKIYNNLGELVKDVLIGEYKSGYYEVNVNFDGLPSGIYFYELRSNDFSETKQMIFLK